MESMETNGNFEDVLAEIPASVGELARRARRLIESVYPNAIEVPWPRQRTVGYGVGPRKNTEHFCWLGLYAAHLNLGFNHGVALEDPAGLLRGTGVRFRHVRIEGRADLENPEVENLIRSAIEERLLSLGR